PSRCGPRTEKGSPWRAPARASRLSWAVTAIDYPPSRVREDGVDVCGDETRQVFGWTVQGENPPESRAADREVPAFAFLRSKERELPFLETWPRAADGGLDRRVQPRAKRRI